MKRPQSFQIHIWHHISYILDGFCNIKNWCFQFKFSKRRVGHTVAYLPPGRAHRSQPRERAFSSRCAGGSDSSGPDDVRAVQIIRKKAFLRPQLICVILQTCENPILELIEDLFQLQRSCNGIDRGVWSVKQHRTCHQNRDHRILQVRVSLYDLCDVWRNYNWYLLYFLSVEQ